MAKIKIIGFEQRPLDDIIITSGESKEVNDSRIIGLLEKEYKQNPDQELAMPEPGDELYNGSNPDAVYIREEDSFLVSENVTEKAKETINGEKVSDYFDKLKDLIWNDEYVEDNKIVEENEIFPDWKNFEGAEPENFNLYKIPGTENGLAVEHVKNDGKSSLIGYTHEGNYINDIAIVYYDSVE